MVKIKIIFRSLNIDLNLKLNYPAPNKEADPMAKSKAKPEQIWWCAACNCVFTRKNKSDETGCPKCKSDDVFMDEELWCPSCKTNYYGPNQKDAGDDWYKPEDECPECKNGYSNPRPKLKLKPPRKLSSLPKPKRK